METEIERIPSLHFAEGESIQKGIAREHQSISLQNRENGSMIRRGGFVREFPTAFGLF